MRFLNELLDRLETQSVPQGQISEELRSAILADTASHSTILTEAAEAVAGLNIAVAERDRDLDKARAEIRRLTAAVVSDRGEVSDLSPDA